MIKTTVRAAVLGLTLAALAGLARSVEAGGFGSGAAADGDLRR